MPANETVIKNEIVRVKGKVKAITVPKEKTEEILKRVELRVLDKKYEALMPPLDDMKKNNIDVQGFARIINEFLNYMILGNFNVNYSPSTLAEIVINTASGSPVTLQYATQMSGNSQGVVVLSQAFSNNNLMNIQYYFVGFDTTNSSYQGSSLELYTVAITVPYKTDTIRIAYANLSVNKSSNENLFIVWLIEYQGVPYYLLSFIPTFASSIGIYPLSPINGSNATQLTIYGYNGNCNLACNGNCPSANLQGYIVTVQNGTPIVQIPSIIPVGNAVSSANILICTSVPYYISSVSPSEYSNINQINISSSYSTSVALSPGGSTFYVLLLTLSITFQVS